MTHNDNTDDWNPSEVHGEVEFAGDLATGTTPAVELLWKAIERRATDIHFDPHQDYVDVRLRIDGRLERFRRVEHKAAMALLSQFNLMAGLDIAEPFRAKEGRLRLPASLAGYQVRITTARVVEGEAAKYGVIIAVLNRCIDIRIVRQLPRINISSPDSIPAYICHFVMRTMSCQQNHVYNEATLGTKLCRRMSAEALLMRCMKAGASFRNS